MVARFSLFTRGGADSEAAPSSSRGVQEAGQEPIQEVEDDEEADMAAAIAASLASSSAAAVIPSAADDSLRASKPVLIDPGPEPDEGPGRHFLSKPYITDLAHSAV